MARKTTPNPDPQDLRTDLLAALAAGRELGPEMDAAIVDAHLRRHFGDAVDKPKAPVVVERQPVDLRPFVMPLMMVVGLAAFIAVLVLTHGWGWFLIWPLMAWGCWGRGGRGGRSYRYDRVMARRERRWDRDSYYLSGQDGERVRTTARHEIV